MTPREPDDVGPAVGGDLRASDADRNQVLDLLSAAYAEGRLTRDEHDERTGQATRARTFDDLIPLTRDLVPINSPLPQQRHQPTPASPAVRRSAGADRPDTLIGIMGGSNREGPWQVRAQTRSFALMGGNDLDLTEATFDAPEAVIEGAWIMGGLTLLVPEGVNVRDETIGVMGGTDVKGLRPHPDGPTLVLKGVCLMGGIDVYGPDSKSFRRKIARRQRKRQRRGGHGH